MPEANVLFEEKATSTKADGNLQSWDLYQTELKTRLQIYADKYYAGEAMKPEIILSKLEQKIASLEDAWIRNVEFGRELAEEEREREKERGSGNENHKSPNITTVEELNLTVASSEAVIHDTEKENSHVQDVATERMMPTRNPVLAAPSKDTAMTEATIVHPETTEGNEDTKESSKIKEKSEEQDSG